MLTVFSEHCQHFRLAIWQFKQDDFCRNPSKKLKGRSNLRGECKDSIFNAVEGDRKFSEKLSTIIYAKTKNESYISYAMGSGMFQCSIFLKGDANSHYPKCR